MIEVLGRVRESGVTMVIVEHVMQVIMNLSDRIAVLYEGKVMGVVENDNLDIEEIGLLMGGRTKAKEAA